MQPRGLRGWTVGQAHGDEYETHFARREAAGQDIHGEAVFIASLEPRSVLDAGCGTGRVARELDLRDIDVVGVDIDPNMLETARHKAPHLSWIAGDLTTVSLDRTFDVVVLAGNVMIFLVPGSEEAVIANLAAHLNPTGMLVSGFQLGFSLTPEQYDQIAARCGLALRERWATWDRQPWKVDDSFVVSVHRLP